MACYGESFTLLYVDDVRTSQKHIRTSTIRYEDSLPHRKHTYGLSWLVRRIALFFFTLHFMPWSSRLVFVSGFQFLIFPRTLHFLRILPHLINVSLTCMKDVNYRCWDASCAENIYLVWNEKASEQIEMLHNEKHRDVYKACRAVRTVTSRAS
jgi:hypothetical protein